MIGNKCPAGRNREYCQLVGMLSAPAAGSICSSDHRRVSLRLSAAVLILLLSLIPGVRILARGVPAILTEEGNAESRLSGTGTDYSQLAKLWQVEAVEEIYSRYLEADLLMLEPAEQLVLGYSAFQLASGSGGFDHLPEQQLQYIQKSTDAAERFLVLHAELADGDVVDDVRLMAAYGWYVLKNYPKSKNVIVKAYENSPRAENLNNLRIIEGMIAVREQKPAEALTIWARVDPVPFGLRILQFQAAVLSGSVNPVMYLTEAAAAATGELEIFSAVTLHGQYLLARQRYRDAVSQLLPLLENLESPYLLSSVCHQLGRIYQRQGNMIEARAMFNRSLGFNPQNTFTLEILSP